MLKFSGIGYFLVSKFQNARTAALSSVFSTDQSQISSNIHACSQNSIELHSRTWVVHGN
jgi:hypothetical protein